MRDMAREMTPQERAAVIKLAEAIRDDIGITYISRDGLIQLPWEGDWVGILASYIARDRQQTRRAALLEAVQVAESSWSYMGVLRKLKTLAQEG